jgi:hypothetical protein
MARRLPIERRATTRDRSNGNGLIDYQSPVKAQGRAGAPGLVEEPNDFAELIIVQFMGRPVLIDQLSDVAVPDSTGHCQLKGFCVHFANFRPGPGTYFQKLWAGVGDLNQPSFA